MPGKHVHFSEDVHFPPTPSPSYTVTSLPSSYGPVTPPQNTYLPMTGMPAIHPVLEFTGCAPPLSFDVTLPVQNVKPSTNIFSPNILYENATAPAVASLVITHPRLLWDITIRPSEGKCVRVCDVLSGIYTSLRQQASGTDYESLPSHTAKSEVTAAFARRWMRIPDPAAKSVEKSKGLKRVDFLGSTVTFGGLSRSQSGPNYWNLVLA
ncbi:hypothetical protein DFH07DRAFT_808771 [Mycena maculata]|uniref:DUF6699 domain-containing protein n=1 Tax=Mycena maculata TaxID=230809 RepID=A0AAD7NN18_9AGAR|nr:hypothetical protein DFH07DRAFT_808771 [Mycena maculata]